MQLRVQVVLVHKQTLGLEPSLTPASPDPPVRDTFDRRLIAASDLYVFCTREFARVLAIPCRVSRMKMTQKLLLIARTTG